MATHTSTANSMTFRMFGSNVLYIDFKHKTDCYRREFEIWVKYGMLYELICKFLSLSGYPFEHSYSKEWGNIHGNGYVATVLPEPEDEESAEPNIISMCSDVIDDYEKKVKECQEIEKILKSNGFSLNHPYDADSDAFDFDYCSEMNISCIDDKFQSFPILNDTDFTSICQADFQNAIDELVKKMDKDRNHILVKKNSDYSLELDYTIARAAICKNQIRDYYERGANP